MCSIESALRQDVGVSSLGDPSEDNAAMFVFANQRGAVNSSRPVAFGASHPRVSFKISITQRVFICHFEKIL